MVGNFIHLISMNWSCQILQGSASSARQLTLFGWMVALFHTIIQCMVLLHNFYNYLNNINSWKQIILLQSAVLGVKDSMPSKTVWSESCWRNLSEHTWAIRKTWQLAVGYLIYTLRVKIFLQHFSLFFGWKTSTPASQRSIFLWSTSWEFNCPVNCQQNFQGADQPWQTPGKQPEIHLSTVSREGRVALQS